MGFSLVVESRGYSLVLVHRLLIVVVTLVEHGFQGMSASVVVAHRLSYSEACGIFPDQGLNLCPLHWQAILNQWTMRVFSTFVYILYCTE